MTKENIENVEAVTTENTASEAKPLEELNQEELVAKLQAQEEQLTKATKKATDFEKAYKIEHGKLKEVKGSLEEKPPVVETPKPETDPANVTQEDVARQISEAQLLAQANVVHPQDLETFNKYRGNMTVAEAVNDPNIKNILTTNRADREAQAQANGLEGISGGQTTMTDKQFMNSVQNDPAKLAAMTADDRQRYGRLLAAQ